MKISIKLDAFFQACPEFVRRHRFPVLFTFVILAALWATGVSKFKLDLSDEFFFKPDDPVRVAYDRFREQFGGDEWLYLVYQAKDGDIFSSNSIRAVQRLQKQLNANRDSYPLNHISDITSLINVSYYESSGDGLISRQFVGTHIPVNKSDSDRLRQKALNHPDYKFFYLSEDSRYGAILIRTDFRSLYANPGGDMPSGSLESADITLPINSIDKESAEPVFKYVEMHEYADFMDKIDTIIQLDMYSDHLTFYPVGAPAYNAYMWNTIIPQTDWTNLMAYILVIVALFVMFRSLSAVIWPIAIVVISTVLTIATMGWLGLTMNIMIHVTLFLILVIGIADSVHILSGYVFHRRQGLEHEPAIRVTYKNSGKAVFLTSITTACGMLALLSIPMLPVQRFGVSAAIGIMFAFVFSICLLPLMLDIWSPVKKIPSLNKKMYQPHLVLALLLKIERWVFLTPKSTILVFVLLGVIFSFGISRVTVDSNPIEIFDENNSYRQASELVDDKLAGSRNLEILISSQAENALYDPRLLLAMDKLQHYVLSAYPEIVVSANSLVNVVKETNKALSGGDKQYYSIPSDGDLLAQTLFLINNANPVDRRRVVSDDFRSARISVNLKNLGSKEYAGVVERIRREAELIFEPLMIDHPELNVEITGSVALTLSIFKKLSWSQITGFAIALVVISAILLVFLRSFSLGLIALIPNVFPIVVVFGMMGYLNIPVDVDTLIIAPLMIGIVVDDTIHFLFRYRKEMTAHGDIIHSISAAYREVGQAIIFTSIVLAIAFLGFLFIEHRGLNSFGMLSSVAIFSALAAELFLLPSLLIAARSTVRTSIKPSKALTELP